ncbi:MAG TPA: hypothetical protein VGZ91_12695 [Candidatus Sulfotelmatobacter sp.]|nr:hypothetical protein [Candidatus Sulfotelmatobacter sp.]
MELVSNSLLKRRALACWARKSRDFGGIGRRIDEAGDSIAALSVGMHHGDGNHVPILFHPQTKGDLCAYPSLPRKTRVTWYLHLICYDTTTGPCHLPERR